MKNAQIAIFVVSIFCLSFSKIFAQKTKKYYFAVNIGTSYPDKRLFEFSNESFREIVKKQGKGTIDTYFDFSLLRTQSGRKFIFGNQQCFGIGIYTKIQPFPRPLNKGAFDNYTLELRLGKKYIKHGVIVPIILKKHFSENKTITLSATTAFSLVKWMSDTRKDDKLFKIKSNFDNVDFEIGLLLKKLWLKTRFLNFSRIDNVMFNQSYFNKSNPPFLKRKIDFYTMPKISIGLIL